MFASHVAKPITSYENFARFLVVTLLREKIIDLETVQGVSVKVDL